MTDLEFTILDELYFVITYKKLKKQLQLSEEVLFMELSNLLEKSWVKIFESDFVTEVEYDNSNFEENINRYCYLATKSGLFEHNSI